MGRSEADEGRLIVSGMSGFAGCDIRDRERGITQQRHQAEYRLAVLRQNRIFQSPGSSLSATGRVSGLQKSLRARIYRAHLTE